MGKSEGVCVRGIVWWRERTFVRELGNGTLDGEGVAWLEPLMHVLANNAILVLLN